MTAGVVAGLAVRDTVLVAGVGVCSWHTLAATLRYAKTHRAILSSLADKDKSAASMQRMSDLMTRTSAQLWINHDKAQAATMKRPPAYYD